MQIKLTFKDPDGVYDSVTEAAKRSLETIKGLSEEEREQLQEIRRDTLMDKIKRWVEYGEILSVQIDTEAGTAVVLPRGGS